MLNLVLGGPGCGKTTYLLGLIDDLFKRNVPPDQIGYVTFTRKAAHEGLQRASAKFEIARDDLPYFSTLHAFCYNQLGLSPAEVMSHSNFIEFGNHIGLEVAKGPLEDHHLEGVKKSAEKALSLISFARITCQPLDKICHDVMYDYNEAEWIRRSFALFKKSRGLMDFTDIVEVFIEKGAAPSLQALIVDEAQDLSALQWQLVNKLAENTPVLYFAGDDDQAIYEWAGADVPYFLNLKGKQHILPISYRLKSEIFNTCQSIVNNIRKRYPKDWKPWAEGGEITRLNRIEHVEFVSGSWLILARNNYLLEAAKAHLKLKGYPYNYGKNKSTIDNDHVRSIIIWETLRKGAGVTGEQAKLVYRNMLVKHREVKQPAVGDDEIVHIGELVAKHGLLSQEDWMTVLRIPAGDSDYYRDIKLRGESLIDVPRITISTIHGVKGGEADHVLLFSDMSYASHEELVKEPSSESRVFYTAVSRAKESLHIVNPQTRRFYPIGGML